MESGLEPGGCFEGHNYGAEGARHKPCFLCNRSLGLENQVSLCPGSNAV